MRRAPEARERQEERLKEEREEERRALAREKEKRKW